MNAIDNVIRVSNGLTNDSLDVWCFCYWDCNEIIPLLLSRLKSVLHLWRNSAWVRERKGLTYRLTAMEINFFTGWGRGVGAWLETIIG